MIEVAREIDNVHLRRFVEGRVHLSDIGLGHQEGIDQDQLNVAEVDQGHGHMSDILGQVHEIGDEAIVPRSYRMTDVLAH